tara:strand:+ start:27819 stop:29900 length:2082 start_codon:yes stop_codon:yes gene_type:complete
MIKNQFNCILIFIILGIFTIFIGCSKDDDQEQEVPNPFYANKLDAANPEKLDRIWSIFEGELLGEKVSIPENNPECGRDFFTYSKNGRYSEYEIIDNYECIPQINNFNWILNKGVITISNPLGESLELVILELTDQKFVFKAEIDFDQDGKEDLFTFTAKPYQPPTDKDFYSTSFNRDVIIPHYDKIRLSWRPYQGFNNFIRYEIYRSDSNCNKSNAKLISTISNQDTDFFIDEDPAVSSELCYFFKLYTDKGLLAESEMISVDPIGLQVATVIVAEPQLNGENIDLSWSKYDGYYFAYYEISVRNYTDGSGYGFQEEVLAQINDINTIKYKDIDPPFLSNPVYIIRAVDIFGNKTQETTPEKNSWEVLFKRSEVLNMTFIRQVAIDPEETTIYVYGKILNNPEENFQKFNYVTNSVEAISNQSPNTSSEGTMKLVKSEYGKELIFPVSDELRIYDADNLNFKYTISTNGFQVSDFEYLGNNIWIMSDNDYLMSFKREGNSLLEISRQIHFSEHQAFSSYQILPISNDQIILGHYNENSSLLFTISQTGEITNRTVINSVIRSADESDIKYSSSQNKIFGLKEHNVYSDSNFNLLQTFIEPNFALGISTNGDLILGSNNDPTWSIDENSLHEKKAIVYNLSTQSKKEYNTKGYPHIIFQNYLGELISISSGFKRKNLKDYPPKPDIFIEKIIQ